LTRATVYAALGAIAAVCLIVQFTTLNDYIDAVEFTRATGAGTAIFRTALTPFILLLCIFAAGLLIGRRPIPIWATHKSDGGRILTVGLVLALSLLATQNAITHSVWFATLTMALTGFLLMMWPAKGVERDTWTWTTILFLTVGSLMVITSGNG